MRGALRRLAIGALAAVALTAGLSTGGTQAGGAEYALESTATYDVDPAARVIGVTVDVTFTNTTPDPPGQFSVFDEVKLAVHDDGAEFTVTDEDGELGATAEVESGVNVLTVELRDDLRHEETAEFQVSYELPDTDGPHLRVRESGVVFPAWSFGTAGEVRVVIPTDYEVHVDGDPLTPEGEALVSGEIEDPSAWLALVKAVAPEPTYASSEATAPLAGGTAAIEVRSFADDEAWGERVLSLVQRALPVLEEEIGLPYPATGRLVLAETVGVDATGLGEGPESPTGEIQVAFDQPDFTIVHQLAHVWLNADVVDSRWITEGMASEVAERTAERLDIERPYDPAEVVAELEDAAFRLDEWPADAGPAAESYGYASSWDVIAQIRAAVGEEGLRQVLTRVTGSIGPYRSAEVSRDVAPEAPPRAPVPLTTRSFIDHLEAVSDADLAELFSTRVLSEADAALLEERAAAREAFDALVAASGGWGAPDPVSGAMTAWSFEEAQAQIEAAREWLAERDAVVAELAAAGLSAPARLQQSYRTHGGAADAYSELSAEREVAASYAETADAVNAERSFLERVGLIGGPDPAQQLRLANGRFADGDLTGALSAIREAQQVVRSAEAGGIARLASVVVIVLILLGVAVMLVRRRASRPQE